MLKTTRSPDEPAPGRNDGIRLVSGKNNGNGEIDKFGDDGVEHAKKSRKLKSQKLAKSQKLSKPGKSKSKKPKKSSKSRNSPNFSTTKSRPSFLIFKARSTFNCLWLAFTEAPIL